MLGRRLFFESALSVDSSLSCAACHIPTAAFTTRGRTFSFGVTGKELDRNTPSLANVGFAKSLTFDGGFSSLEAQVLAPLYAKDEMGMTAEEIESRLAGDSLYVRLYRQAYGNAPIRIDGVAQALATYLRLVVSYRSPWDRWKAGDSTALSAAARRGEAIFTGKKGSCAICHVPPLFTDGSFHNVGLDSVIHDIGRMRITGLEADKGRFKTPSLRNIEHTGPYMHDGSVATLWEAVEHFNAGGVVHAGTDTLIRPLGLTPEEVSDLLKFLDALSDSAFFQQPETLPKNKVHGRFRAL
ncbi:MAG TPA: cytochrome c peroxidase [Fibrobacteria bacterium]|nr:cytochrome c peroxidase [Fibrobacteria bacterium]